MKPLKLKIAGLNSFKGEQEIDFEKLSDLGIFGVFGPTGSGKSSILDAMTLALFGTVVRAERHKQGIINHAETKLFVSFTFALGAGMQRQVYRIDRAYKTKDHVSVQSTHSRLLDLTTGVDEIIAERDTDVTACVERLLGMKAEDFTRAVVLPQGSFADFLTMETSKRRAMLERLFSLEKYGRQLVDKLNKRYEVANDQFNRLDGEQQGLGDASAERVDEAARRRAIATTAEQAAVLRLGEVIVAHDQGGKIYVQQQELAVKQAELAYCRLQDDHIEEVKSEVLRAEQAEQVKPLLGERDAVALKLQTIDTQCLTLQVQLENCQAAGDILEASLFIAKDNRTKQEPKLLKRKAELETAKILETEVSGLEARGNKIQSRISQEGKQLAETTDNIVVITSSLAVLTDAITQLEQQATASVVAADYRQLVHQAGSHADSLERELATWLTCKQQRDTRITRMTTVRQQLAQAEQTIQAITTTISAQAQAEQEAQSQCPADETTLTEREIQLAELNSKLRELSGQVKAIEIESESAQTCETNLVSAKAAADKLKTECEVAQGTLRKLHDQMTALLLSDRQTMAAKLASGLTEGEPCPVCGAAHHPQPATNMEVEGRGEQAQKEQLAAEIELATVAVWESEAHLRQAEHSIISFQTKLTAVMGTIQAAKKQFINELRYLAKKCNVGSEQAELAYLSHFAKAQQEELSEGRVQLATWRSERQAAEKRQRELEQQLSGATSTAAANNALLQEMQTELDRSNSELEQLASQGAALSEDLSAVLAQIGQLPHGRAQANIALVTTLRQEVAQRDRQGEVLQSQLIQKRTAYQQAQSRREDLYVIERKLTVTLAASRSEQNEVIRTRQERQLRLNQITEGVPVNTLISQVEHSLSQLRQIEQQAQEQADNNKANVDQAKNQLTIAQTQRAGITDRLNEVANQLGQKLLELSFDSEAAVEAAYRNAVLLEAKRKEIQTHTDEEIRLKAQCEELIAKLAGQSISDAEWETLRQKLAEVTQVKEQAVERRIAAEQILADISSRQQRWQALENQLVMLRDQLKHLRTLKELTRGNMLVEFMAQEQMDVIIKYASDRLKHLTNNRYALELASDGSFVIRDDDNGSVKRPVNMLSGGETFQTSLALALALSTQIQLKGEHPLEFFFLDEGFGSLDQKLLEVVMSSLERLPLERMTIGLISHVEALQQRMLRRLIVESAEPNGKGTQVRIEIA